MGYMHKSGAVERCGDRGAGEGDEKSSTGVARLTVRLAGRRDAQGDKTVRRRRRVRRRHRVMCGTLEALKRGLAPHGWQINASFVERLNRDCRPKCPKTCPDR
jgi:hypothetical protein